MLRYILLTAAVLIAVYGVVKFRGGNLRSARYVTRPDSLWWSPFRVFDDAEWTPEGLNYRRRFLIWIGLAAALTLVLVLSS